MGAADNRAGKDARPSSRDIIGNFFTFNPFGSS